MDVKSSFYRKIIVDQPAENDGFEGRGHYRTACQLADTIEEFRNADRSIGLEGDWGSGKSTVVKLAGQRLKDTNRGRFRFFEFDLWSNQTSLFRRTFLEKLINWGTKEFSDDEALMAELEDHRDKVRDRIRVVKTNSSREFDWFGIFFLMVAPVIPLAFMWLSPISVKSSYEAPLGISLFGYNFPLWSIALILILIFYGTFLVRAFQNWRGGAGSPLQALSKSASIFAKHQDKETTTQNIREEDPNDYEFETVCRDVLQSLQSRDKRVVVVFDNIDRLPEEAIANAWADIRAVFAGDPSFPNENERACTAIVPYDREHVISALSAENNGTDDIFRKTFDAIFRVSPPVASNVSELFASTLREGLPNLDSDRTVYNTAKIFEKSTNAQDRPVTPRQIVAFVNEVTGLFSQWGGKIPLETIAIFQVYRDEIETNPRTLQSSDLVVGTYLAVCDDDELYRNLAAIAYNVDPGLAYQILLRAPVEKSVVASEQEELLRLSKSHGFEQVLLEAAETNAGSWAAEGLEVFIQVIRNISALELSEDVRNHLRTLLMERLGSIPPHTLGEAKETEGLRSIIEYANALERKDVALQLARWLVGCIDEKKATFSDGNNWIGAFGNVINLADGSKAEFADYVLENCDLPKNVQFALGVAYDCDQVEVSFGAMQHGLTSKAAVEPLKEMAAENPSHFRYTFEEIRRAKIMLPNDLVELLQGQHDKLTAETLAVEEGAFAQRAKNFISTFGACKTKPKAKEILGALVTHGSLQWHAHELRNEKTQDDALAAAVWLTVQHLGNENFDVGPNQQVPTFGNFFPPRQWFAQVLRGEEDIVDNALISIANHVIQQRQISAWIGWSAEASEKKKMLTAVMEKVAASKDMYAIQFSTLAKHYDIVRTEFGEAIDRVLHMTGEAISDDAIASQDLRQLPIMLLQDTAKRSEKGWVLLHEKLEADLKTIDDEEWRSAISSDALILSVLENQVVHRNFKLRANHFSEPFQQMFVDLLAGAQERSARPRFSEVLLGAIPPGTRKSIPKLIAGRLSNTTVDKDAFSYVLAKFPTLIPEVFKMLSDEQKIECFTIPAIGASSDIELSFVEGQTTGIRAAVKKSDDNLIQRLCEVLESIRDGENRERVERLAQSLGLTLSEQVASDNDEQTAE